MSNKPTAIGLFAAAAGLFITSVVQHVDIENLSTADIPTEDKTRFELFCGTQNLSSDFKSVSKENEPNTITEEERCMNKKETQWISAHAEAAESWNKVNFAGKCAAGIGGGLILLNWITRRKSGYDLF